MTSSIIAVVGSDATMVYDAVHNVIEKALGERDPSFALQNFTVKDVTAGGDSSVLSRIMEALNTPPFLIDRRIVVVRDAHQLVADEVAQLSEWMENPSPDTTLVVAVVGTKANKLVKGASEVIDVKVGTRPKDRALFITEKMSEYHVKVDGATAQAITARVGDDVARIDALARTLQSIYGSAPLNFSHVEPYLGEAGDVPEWDLTNAIDKGDLAKAIIVARRMLDSKERVGLQIINILQRHYLRIARLEGSGIRDEQEASIFLGIKTYGAGQALTMSQRLGAARVAQAVHWITRADMDLKGGVTFGGKDLNTDLDATDLTVVEILIARLAMMSRGARSR